MASLIDPLAFHAGVWANAPMAELMFDQNIAVECYEQYQSYDTTATTGDWVATVATSGTGARDLTQPGSLLIDAGATTATQGYQTQRLGSPFILAANKSLWMEWPILLTAATPPVTKAVLFVGLADSDTTIFASGSQTTTDHIGWRINTAGLLQTTFAAAKASTEGTKTGPLLVAATKIRLGAFYDGVADTLQQYVNGVATGTPIATANIPKVVLYPSLACLSDGTDRPKLLSSGFRIIQLR